MENERVTIKDIAENLGVSTATVSNVIHGKTKKISDTTVAKVQEQLEKSGYIPNMAAVLLAQNTSKIVCVILSDDRKYEGKMIEDPFVNGMLNYLSKELKNQGFFMMLREENDIDKIVRYASMWNMSGLILLGFCAVDYERLRQRMHIPFVVVDAYQKEMHLYSDVGIDNIKGGYLAGQYLIQMGHQHIMYLADNDEDCDHYRYVGLTKAMREAGITVDYNDFKKISDIYTERQKCYEQIVAQIHKYTAVFAASDLYAIEFMSYVQSQGIRVPDDISIIGFDDIPLGSYVNPALTTISQNLQERSRVAVKLLMELMEGAASGHQELLPVELVIRRSVKKID